MNSVAPQYSQASTDPFESTLKHLFGQDAYIIPLASTERMGRRIHNIDLSQPLTSEQAKFMVALLDQYHIISFPAQDQNGFHLRDLERLNNHFGAPLPHPKNYANYRDTHDALSLPPVEKRVSTQVNQAFPGQVECLEGADNPVFYIVTNLAGSGPDKTVEIASSLHWHTDIEFEPIPLSTSMFYVQSVPSTRGSADGHWVHNPPHKQGFYHPESSQRLSDLREATPLNGETAYTDTAAAYAALPLEEQHKLDKVMLRRRLRVGDPGWLIPLVYTNPRTGTKSLHSPVWASRGKNIAPVEVDGLSVEASREFLDGLEEHSLQAQFRYDHKHMPGDVTLWSNFATLHNAPPYKRIINNPDDARLMYRISCKGEPSYELPRNDSDEWIENNISPPYRSAI